MRTRILALALAAATLSLTACSSEEPPAGNGESFPAELVGYLDISGDTDAPIRQFTFTDLDGVRQKCFHFGSTRGGISCQAVSDNR